MTFWAANVAIRATPLISRATIVVAEATTGQSLLLGGGAVATGATVLSKVEGGLGTWTIAATRLQGVYFGPYGYLKALLKGSGGQANHLNQIGAYSKIIKDAGACVNLIGNAFKNGTEHNQFHMVIERFWNQYREGGAKFNQPVSNQAYLQALSDALGAVNDAVTGAAAFTKSQIDALVELAEAEQRGYGYSDEVGGARPDVPKSMNLTNEQ
jgi:hypothetical protein